MTSLSPQSASAPSSPAYPPCTTQLLSRPSDETAHCRPTLKAGFVLLSSPQHPIPSTRVAALNPMPLLAEAGVESVILFAPDTPSETPELPDDLLGKIRASGLDVVVFQKVRGASVLRLAKQLQRAGIATVYLVCDLVEIEMAEATDATVLVTDHLRSLYPARLQHKLHVVHDGIERPEHRRGDVIRSRGSRRDPLRAILVTSAGLDRLPELAYPPDWLSVLVVGAYAPRNSLRAQLSDFRSTVAAQTSLAARVSYLRFLANPRIRCIPWHADEVYRHLVQADVAIIPIDKVANDPTLTAPAWSVKSENRLTLKMAIGLPVVATPIPAYEPIIKQGRNGFLASGRADWLSKLNELRDPDLRLAMGNTARASVIDAFSVASQARRLHAVLRKLPTTKRDLNW